MDATPSRPDPATVLDRLAATLGPDLTRVDALIRDTMVSRHAPRIADVSAHIVGAGGKRVRPMLVLAASRLVSGAAGENALRLAAAVEFIHTATLLHDDVVDESRQRRGRPTANLLWDNKSSVLVGDYLFARSFQLMTATGEMRTLDILADASATIAEGEVLQLTAAANLATDEAVYLQVVRGKTAALFAAAAEVGALAGGGTAAEAAALRDYGDALGIAFQIADDCLDYGGASAVIGKNTGDDFRERKVTLPLIKALAADPASRAFWARVIEDGKQAEGDLDEALARIEATGALTAARQDALAWADRAKRALEGLPRGPVHELMAELADFVVARVA